jgi:CRISPR-associated protein Cmr5
MSKKRVENYIPRAIEVLEKKFKNKAIPKEYNGYISAFGAGIIQNGLKPTVAIYENKQANNKSDKDVLTEIILQIIDKDSKENSLLRYILSSKEDEDILKEKIKDAAIAIKLSIRTFKLVENKDK